MTTYHRYIIANLKRTTVAQLREALRRADACLEIDGEVVLYNGKECGILIDVCDEESPNSSSDFGFE